MKEKQLTEVGQLISNILKNRDDELALVSLKDQVNDLAVSYQPYG
jgi:glycine/serine hydroxymethyltransferase